MSQALAEHRSLGSGGDNPVDRVRPEIVSASIWNMCADAHAPDGWGDNLGPYAIDGIVAAAAE